jgi:tetratricopeptide (TPR) repeat protein/tRNA A-37 threonylcarbamoyl transferase component Bud32
MKSFSPGLSDSIACVTAAAAPCPYCASESRVGGGLCVGCLLQSGLEPEEDCTPETLESALAEVAMPDQNWRLGNYEILEEIGRGGMGVIYRARQRHSRRIVAVKRVLGYHADSGETLARFRREAQAAASLDHPNILPIYEVSESEEGLPFFSMKFAPGGNLAQASSALRSEPRQCVALMAKVTRAVQYAHSKGILHRDLKPGNILLDGHGEPFVSDFGLAKWLEGTSDLTRTLTIFGTPGYIAPEQASESAAQVKPTADVYSLGAILFDLLAGRPPFLGSHALSVIKQATEMPAPKLCSLSKVADRDLQTICARCLEREPEARYCSAGDLAEDLERWLEGRPIIARPVIFPVRLWRWSRRNPLLAGSLAACVILGFVAAGRQFQSWGLQATVTTGLATGHSIEVMPLFDLDEVRTDGHLTAALAGDLRSSLSAIGPSIVHYASEPDLKAQATLTRAAADKTVSMRSVMSGTVRTLNGKRRVSLRLLNAANGEPVFHQVIDLDQGVNSASALSQAISREVYSILDAPDLSQATETSQDPGLRDKQSRELITAARELADRRSPVDLQRAESCLRRAIGLQPQSAKAHSELAKVLTLRVAYTSDRTPLPAAEVTARLAIELDPRSAEAHQALAAVFYHTGLFGPALEELQQAFECSGIFSRGANMAAQIYRSLGRPDKSLAWAWLAQKNEPHPAENEASIGDSWSELEEDDRAESSYNHYAVLHPEQPEGWMGICRLRLLQEKVKEARLLYQENLNHHPEFTYNKQMAAEVEFFARDFAQASKLYEELFMRETGGGGDFYGEVTYRSALGRIRMESDPKQGRQLLEEARKIDQEVLQRAPHHPDALYRLAAIEASLGERELALDYLTRAFRAGWIDCRSPRLDPRFDSLRSDKRFLEILEEMNGKVTSLRTAALAVVNDPANTTQER